MRYLQIKRQFVLKVVDLIMQRTNKEKKIGVNELSWRVDCVFRGSIEGP